MRLFPTEWLSEFSSRFRLVLLNVCVYVVPGPTNVTVSIGSVPANFASPLSTNVAPFGKPAGMTIELVLDDAAVCVEYTSPFSAD